MLASEGRQRVMTWLWIVVRGVKQAAEGMLKVGSYGVLRGSLRPI